MFRSSVMKCRNRENFKFENNSVKIFTIVYAKSIELKDSSLHIRKYCFEIYISGSLYQGFPNGATLVSWEGGND